ncbi:uncharacterized protein NECHADRAFT_88238 [Fusarium vanettenii 77-13-4]|uniref:Uncharacterized protein n=1 Tax=Fusarium vanettenii (strain ATCC MYA-4622 / CBS 123669 / FGSC 9596 / NRRL 45880 / 77-13-4) TaxID=660122 RepID=C7ZDS7_FUSV7|nr:uncharacterized protein NECHADRAFT_88238 [Fusarium vanettenii 77-13-4]EEU37803.1 predicted protein [Fusarium vanettenii 77-13-4]
MSTSWQKSPSLGRFTGSPFASTVINTLTSATSPLLDDDETSDAIEESLQPDEPTPQQTETYNEFCRSILEVCKTRVTSAWDSHTFTFSAQNDSWDHSWTGRTGIPLTNFETRWDALEIIPPVTEADATAQNSMITRTVGPSSTEPSIVDEMTRSIRQKHVSSMAGLFLKTCPGDENRGWGPLVHGMLSRAADGALPSNELEEIAGMICFRWESALIADYLVETFNLPKPGGQICILWDSRPWRLEVGNYPLHNMIFDKLVAKDFPPFPAENQGPPFQRFLFYMAAAVALKDLPEPSTIHLIDQLTLFMTKAKEFQEQRAMSDRSTLERAQLWFKALGRRMKSS